MGHKFLCCSLVLTSGTSSSGLTGIESLKCFCFSEEEEGVVVCSEYSKTCLVVKAGIEVNLLEEISWKHLLGLSRQVVTTSCRLVTLLVASFLA